MTSNKLLLVSLKCMAFALPSLNSQMIRYCVSELSHIKQVAVVQSAAGAVKLYIT